jgi:hypothetical protein
MKRFIWHKRSVDYVSTNQKLLMVKLNLATGKYDLYDLSVCNDLIGSFKEAHACFEIAEALC